MLNIITKHKNKKNSNFQVSRETIIKSYLLQTLETC